ncbi:flagellar filament capping protein FliD [Alteribacillus sp. HJP-4]
MAGFASGMEIDQIVRDMMRVERIPVDRMMQKRQTVEWQVDEYRSVNRLLDEFRNNIFDSVMRQANMKSRTAFSTNEGRVTATAASTAGNTSYRISEVSQLAEAASQSSAGRIGGSGFDASKALSEQSLGESAPEWKTGVLQQETISSQASGSKFSIEKEGLLDTAAEDMVVKVDGQLYNVVTDDRELAEDQVRITFAADLGGMELEFGKSLSAKADISVHERQSFTPSSERNSFQLRKGSVDAASLEIRIDGGAPLVIVTDQEAELQEGQAYLNSSTGAVRLASATEGTVEVTFSQQYTRSSITSFNENGESVKDTFLIQSGQSLNQVLQGVNRSSAGVNTFYDDFTGKIAFTRSEAGDFNRAGEEMLFEGDFFTNVLGMKNSGVSADAGGGLVVTGPDGASAVFAGLHFSPEASGESAGVLTDETGAAYANQWIEVNGRVVGRTDESGNLKYEGFQGGRNARFTVNGLETERTSNTFTLNGMTLTLKETFSAEEGAVTIGSSIDTDKIYDTITGFVNEYNELLDKINEKLTETRFRDYPPLTGEQRGELSDREAEMWDEKAQSGLLRNDRMISGFTNTFRTDLYGAVGNGSAYNQLTTIGISTTRNYNDRGRLEFDETKLRAAIEQDPDGVFELFAADGASSSEKGIARRLRDSLDQAINSLAERAGGFKGKLQNHQFTLGRDMNNLDNQITNFERRLSETEERYWRQFTAMEKAMAQANEQANMFYSQMFGGGGLY